MTSSRLVWFMLCALPLAWSVDAGSIFVHDTISTCDTTTKELVQHALGTATLYDVAYEWTHRQQVEDWNLQIKSVDESAGMPMVLGNQELRMDASRQCLTVTYRVKVRIPGFLERFLFKISTPIHFSVSTCVTGRKILEQMEITGVPVIGSVLVKSETIIFSQFLRTISVITKVEIPVILFIFKEQVEAAVKQSWHERNILFAREICSS